MQNKSFDRNAHEVAAKNYAKKRRFKIGVYRLLFTSFLVSLVLLVIDIFSLFFSEGNQKIETLIKMIFTIILFFLFLYLDKKWQLRKKTNIITVQTPDTNGVIVGSGEVKTRIGRPKLRDKLRNFFENI
ncbi:hypothetical protein J4420_03230 [Candidatus Woesearchaeota archaeon]|nr:hypothetical protein [Candidatus Woesearchaeota archaeon]